MWGRQARPSHLKAPVGDVIRRRCAPRALFADGSTPVRLTRTGLRSTPWRRRWFPAGCQPP
ncbi:hypothetical protein SERN_0679 [Serinibacter arcticus]|uniref:Uncharacterized protein n=1 Tax=Serinibacter arcticus TaxID=1655435 RepID=A0A4Z1EAJ6_9MICO|nr:hypothetical protein SERN_0679 [Serinibacter arcticus]